MDFDFWKFFSILVNVLQVFLSDENAPKNKTKIISVKRYTMGYPLLFLRSGFFHNGNGFQGSQTIKPLRTAYGLRFALVYLS